MNNISVKKEGRKSKFRETVEAVFTALIIAFFIRSFIIEAFKIPSPSMVPTLVIGDHLFVNKFAYGIRIPFTKKRIVDIGTPQRGDVVVFIFPGDKDKNILKQRDFIKRVIGIPGDEVRVAGTDVFVNGALVEKTRLTPRYNARDKDVLLLEDGTPRKIPFTDDYEMYDYFEEKMGDKSYIVRYKKDSYHYGDGVYQVPAGHLFVMGDNRDNSDDSRFWGFLPMENLKGRAMFIWLSLKEGGIRLGRFGKGIR